MPQALSPLFPRTPTTSSKTSPPSWTVHWPPSPPSTPKQGRGTPAAHSPPATLHPRTSHRPPPAPPSSSKPPKDQQRLRADLVSVAHFLLGTVRGDRGFNSTRAINLNYSRTQFILPRNQSQPEFESQPRSPCRWAVPHPKLQKKWLSNIGQGPPPLCGSSQHVHVPQ